MRAKTFQIFRHSRERIFRQGCFRIVYDTWSTQWMFRVFTWFSPVVSSLWKRSKTYRRPFYTNRRIVASLLFIQHKVFTRSAPSLVFSLLPHDRSQQKWMKRRIFFAACVKKKWKKFRWQNWRLRWLENSSKVHWIGWKCNEKWSETVPGAWGVS